MNAVYGNAARLMFRRTSEKTRCPGGQKCGVCQRMPEVCQYSTVWTVGARGAGNAAEVPRLLHVDEEVALEDVLPFLVLLGLFVRFVVFPAEYGLALAAIDVSHGVVACCHLTVIWFTFDNVNHVFEQVGASMLAIECPGYHGVDSSEVSATA